MRKNLSKVKQEDLKREIASALTYIKNPKKGIGKKLFDSLFKVTPLSCVELVIVDNIGKPTKIFLTWRDCEYYHGWHCPGGYFRYTETDKEIVYRIIQNELKVKVKNFKFTENRYNNAGDHKRHTLGTLVLVTLKTNPKMKPEEGRWFDVNNLPKDLLGCHKVFLKNSFNW